MSQHQLAADHSWWFLLFALSGSVLLVVQRLFQSVTGRASPLRFEWMNSLLVTLVVAVLVVDAMYLINPDLSPFNAMLRISVVALAVFATWLQIRLATKGRMMESPAWRRLTSFTLLLAAALMVGWCEYRYFYTVAPPKIDEPILAELKSGSRLKSNRYVGVTDRGREIPLFRWKAASDKDLKTISSLMALLTGPLPSVIQREQPDLRSNCHGWVFTHGRFLLDGTHVEQILQDNDYEAVTTPKTGDVVIYRNLDGQIVHTGLVVGILSDNSVMVESKWSVGGRYLHSPEGQPYSQTFSYYRTTRQSHVVAIRFQNKTQVAASESQGTAG